MTVRYKILLIEDEPDLSDLFSTSLKKAGFTVEVIKDGANALDLVKKIKPDLVLLDLIMPKKDGYEVLKEVKCNEATKKTLVYVFSNLTQKTEIEKAMKLGAKDYLIKSDYTPSQLVDKINKIFCLEGKKDSCDK